RAYESRLWSDGPAVVISAGGAGVLIRGSRMEDRGSKEGKIDRPRSSILHPLLTGTDHGQEVNCDANAPRFSDSRCQHIRDIPGFAVTTFVAPGGGGSRT